MGLFERFVMVFISPSELFTGIKQETDIKPTLIYYLIFVLGLSIVSSIISMLLGTIKMSLSVIITWLISVISIFILAFFLGLVASWFGGSRSWVQGLKVAVYPKTIFAIFGLVLALLGTVVLSVTALDFTNPAALLKNIDAFVGIVIVIILVAIALWVWTIILYVKALSISNDLSGGKAIGALIIAGIFTLIVSAIIKWIFTAVGLL